MVLCQKRIKEQHEKDKLIYANMFQKFAERDSKVRGCFLLFPPGGGIRFSVWLDIKNKPTPTFLHSHRQKETPKVKSETKQNGEEEMEAENGEKEVTSAN